MSAIKQQIIEELYGHPGPSEPCEMGWQPIETLPDNERVLLFYPDAQSGIDESIVTGECISWASGISPDLCYFWSQNPNRANIEPTHWMPLPKPPIADKGV